MASKSKARLITANDKMMVLVDHGFEVDVQLKNLTFEDKGIKKMLQEQVAPEFPEGSTEPIRVEGAKAAATVSMSEKYEVDAANPDFQKILGAANAGLYGKAVESEVMVNIPVADRERAAKILQAAGIGATMTTNVSVDPEEYRTLMASPASSAEAAEARKSLQAAVVRSPTFRIKYEKK